MIRDLFLLVLGFGLCSLVHVAWRVIAGRRHGAVFARHYRRFCSGCRIPHMTKTHLPPERSDAAVARISERISLAMRRTASR